MNETTLNALINLFAVFSAISESKKEEALTNFSQYLQLHLGISSFDEYLKLFEELLDLYGLDGEMIFPIDMYEQAQTISKNIKNRLGKDEQIMVFIRFLELSKSGNVQKAEQLFSTLAEVFEINQAELQKFKEFIFHDSPNDLTSPDFLFIDQKATQPDYLFKHIQQKNFNGEILFLKSELIGHFIFIFSGKDDITLEGNPILPGLKKAALFADHVFRRSIIPTLLTVFWIKKALHPLFLKGKKLSSNSRTATTVCTGSIFVNVRAQR